MQARVIGMILVASSVVMIILAYALVSVLTQRLVSQKEDVAQQELERARTAVEQQIDATSSANSVQVRINSARAALGQLSAQQGDTQTVYEPVIVVENQDGSVTTSPEDFPVPDQLREMVDQGQIAQQYFPAPRENGDYYNALLVGTPTDTDIPHTQVYLALSMESEESTMALMRGLLSAAGVVVVVLLVGIAWLATQQVITPIRSASRIAQRLAAGHLKERMAVDSDDEMGRLAASFNNMADKLSSQIAQLEEYGDLQRQFTSDVSHELRTPLTTVRMAADMIEAESDSLPQGAQRASRLMSSELDRFEELLADLLEISRHDAGVADLSTAAIDLRSCVEAAYGQVEHLARELDVEVQLNLPEERIGVEADSRRLERILRNLLANAIDHSEGNPVAVDVAATDTAVGVTVTDHGVGLKPGQEELVFNRFWRADSSRKRHSGGTGLGLAIAREDAVLHGGTLDATGYEGFGSRFRLIIPRTPNTEVGEDPIAVEIPGAPVTSTAAGSELAEPEAEATEAQDTGADAPDAGPASATPAISSGMSSPHVEKSDRGTDGETEGDGILWPSERELNRGAAAPDRRAYKAPDFEGRRK
ncbi:MULTISPECIES: MtrAB system histidine kinase MtrB [Corynebacterium]|uniref:Sensor histidine kinase MtrB n=2 Tax=Corynebacterium TaxID=1716 RepID=A0A8I1LBX6_9CORY|nr:MtrAB system histidine kinase MtrB [Corynebacterium tuberculostearicum]EFQ80964.1 ATPase/histidine kinase/DNA gyrase B/HSP90 domain protein [Corynebacterium pseudogenitalium ATCC 33035]MBK3428645.1 HAMP domain-containing histidine kinase [Corynebacterium tuberculostearicum]